VSAYSGQHFAELMSTPGDELYADAAAPPGTVLAWSFAHRGRCAGNDVLHLLAGPAGGALSSVATASTTDEQWRVYSGACLAHLVATACPFLCFAR